jgi:hypothetical protein
MNSAGSISFWFQQEDREASPGWSSEIDVFEPCGKSATHDQRYYTPLDCTANSLAVNALPTTWHHLPALAPEIPDGATRWRRTSSR